MTRLSDTAALVSAPIPSDDDSCSVSVNVERISNGYVTRRTEYGNGDYKSIETYSADAPRISVESGPKQRQSSALRNAIKSMR